MSSHTTRSADELTSLGAPLNANANVNSDGPLWGGAPV
jgi:hypothetical protein